MKPWLRSSTVAVGILWLTAALLLTLILENNSGHFAYALDDAYIHMAIAKNLSQAHTFSISDSRFTSATSSLLWPWLLGLGFAVFKVQTLLSLFLNLLFGTLLLLYLGWVTRDDYTGRNGAQLVLLLAIVFITPLFALIFSGMEHTLQLLLSLVFLVSSARWLAAETQPVGSKKNSLIVIFLAPLLTATRYEGVFCVMAVCAFLFLRRQFRGAVALGAAAALPILVFGGVFMSRGHHFIPNTLLLKSNLPSSASGSEWVRYFSGYQWYLRMFSRPYLFSLFLAAGVSFIFRNRHGFEWSRANLLLSFYLVVLVLHVQFAQTGYFYRYDAYLIGLGIFVLAPFLRELFSVWFTGADFKRRLPAIAVFTILMIFPAMMLGQRAYRALMDIPVAAGNIYQQQYQMGRFIQQCYSGSTVALNDIGAVNFMARIDCLDLSGLDDARAFALLRTNQYDADAISRLAEDRRVRIALIYEELFCRNPGLISVGRPLGLPKTWLRVAEWTISNNVVCGGTTVSFFATSPEEARLLRSNLIEFAPQLPKSVKVTMS